jgi:hypothetical protein
MLPLSTFRRCVMVTFPVVPGITPVKTPPRTQRDVMATHLERPNINSAIAPCRRDSQPVCVVSGFPIPHVTEYTVRSWSSNPSTHSHSCSVIRFQIRIVQSSDADARYRPFGAHARDHTVDEWPVSVKKQTQSSLGSSR